MYAVLLAHAFCKFVKHEKFLYVCTIQEFNAEGFGGPWENAVPQNYVWQLDILIDWSLFCWHFRKAISCSVLSLEEACCLLVCSYCSCLKWLNNRHIAKAVPLHATKVLGGRTYYSSYSFITLALDGGGSVSCLGCALSLWKEPPVHIVQEARWAPEPVWTQRLEEKSSRLCRRLNLDRPVVHPVARHYTDWATPALNRHTVFHIQQYQNACTTLGCVAEVLWVQMWCNKNK
jgi:hypothetical protein